MEYPSEEIKRSDLEQNLRPIEELECIDVKICELAIDPQEDGAIDIWEIEGKKYGYELDSYEATHLCFARTGYANLAHIKTPYQMLIETHQEYGTKLESVTVEAKHGDVFYARLCWVDHLHRHLYSVCSVPDALIYHSLTPKSAFRIVRSVLNEMEPIDEWNSHQEYFAS